MSATTHRQLPLYPEKEPTVKELLCVLLSRVNRWQGTFSQLVEVLHINMAPRSLAVQVKKCKDELQNAWVYVNYKKSHGKHIVSLSCASGFNQNVIEHLIATESMGCSKIGLPFKWDYGEVVELSEEEKREVNRPVTNGTRKRY